LSRQARDVVVLSADWYRAKKKREERDGDEDTYVMDRVVGWVTRY
jgi:hypothetical protein